MVTVPAVPIAPLDAVSLLPAAIFLAPIVSGFLILAARGRSHRVAQVIALLTVTLMAVLAFWMAARVVDGAVLTTWANELRVDALSALMVVVVAVIGLAAVIYSVNYLEHEGVVGRISSVEPGSSQVMLLTDHASAISAKVVPPGVQGVVEPEVGNPEDLILNFIDSTRKVHAGQDVVTAGWRAQGLESHFPPGLPVGEVSHAPVLEQEASQRVDVRPFADLRNLDLVQVLTGGSRG